MRFERPFILLVLLPIALGLIVVSASRAWMTTDTVIGIELAGDEGEVRIASVAPGSPADEAGIVAGERVLAVSGGPVRSLLVAQDALAAAPAGAPLGLVVMRAGGPESVTIATGETTTWHADRIVATLVASLFLLGAGAVVLRPRRAPATVIYTGFCLAGALVLGVSWTDAAAPVDWALFWVDRVARLLFPALLLHLAVTLRADGGSAIRRWAPALYAPAVALVIVEVHIIGMGSALRAADPIGLVDALQTRVEIAWLILGIGAALATLLLRAQSAESQERARARWVLAGAATGLLPLALLSWAPLLISGSEPAWSWAGLPFLALVPLTFTGAVLDYRLMDLALFVRRALEVVAALVISLVLFFGLLRISLAVLTPFLDPPGLVPALVAALVVAALAPWVRSGASMVVGRLYYRRRYSFRRALRRVARDLNAQRNLPEIAHSLETRVREALDAGACRLLLVREGRALADPRTGNLVRDVLPHGPQLRLADGEIVTLAIVPDAPRHLPQMHHEGVQVLVPLRVENRLIALLAVGPRSGRRLLDSDDLDLLRSVAAHAAAAVAGAQHLAELEDQMRLVQRLQERTASLIESSPMGMAVVDESGRIRSWNRALERILQISARDALDKPFARVLPDVLAFETRTALDLAIARRDSRAYQVRVPIDGDDRLLNLSSTPLEVEGGVDGVLLTVDDVTERVRLEQQLIQQDRLASVGLLAAGIAHEVNTPLTGISSYAQMLLEESAHDDPRRPLLDKIVRQASRASHIARGLLSISRAGTQAKPGGESSGDSVDLVELIDETLALLGLQITRARANVVTEFGGERLVTWGDRSRLQQVMMNLLLNALDALDDGGQVTVRAGRGDDPTAPLFVEIADDGVGIPEGIRDRVFDPFFTTKGPGRGTGLGLSISYSIVREHGGALSLESSAGRGTTMRIALPSAETAIPAHARFSRRDRTAS